MGMSPALLSTRSWKCHLQSTREDHWLVLVGRGGRHDGAIPVPLYVSLEALMGPGPTDAGHLPARNGPGGEAVEDGPEAPGHVRIDKVYERVAQASSSLEVHGQIHEVVEAMKTICVQ